MTPPNRASTPCTSTLADLPLKAAPLITPESRICTRGPEIFPGQPSPISHLPFGRNVWSRLVRTLRVDRSITRVIARNVAHFSAVRRNEGKEKTVCTYSKPHLPHSMNNANVRSIFGSDEHITLRRPRYIHNFHPGKTTHVLGRLRM
jgi:hypothetical protein